jgi:hypothetical protein
MDLEKLLKEAAELRRQIEQLPDVIAQGSLRITAADIDLLIKVQSEIAAFGPLQDRLAQIIRVDRQR